MKSTLLFVVAFASSLAISQSNNQIDQRLLVNKEIGAKAAEFFKTNTAEYDFLVYELDNAYFIQDFDKVPTAHKHELKSIVDVVSIVDNKPFNVSELNDLSTFNFHAYTFLRSQTQTIGYDLGNGKVLVFYSIEKVRENFSQQTTKNQK